MADEQLHQDSDRLGHRPRGLLHLFRNMRSSRGSLLGVSLTGMIDVVFNLLIFFVVITTASQQEGFLPGELPSESLERSGLEIPNLAIMINVYSGDQYDACRVELGGQELKPQGFDTLGQRLRDMHVDHAGLYEGDNPVVLHLANGVSVDQMVKTYNAVVLAGFSNIQFRRSRLDR